MYLLHSKKQNKLRDASIAEGKQLRRRLDHLIDSIVDRDLPSGAISEIQKIRETLTPLQADVLDTLVDKTIEQCRNDHLDAAEAVHRYSDTGNQIVYLHDECNKLGPLPDDPEFTFGHEDLIAVYGWLTDGHAVRHDADGLVLRDALRKIVLHMEDSGVPGFSGCTGVATPAKKKQSGFSQRFRAFFSLAKTAAQ